MRNMSFAMTTAQILNRTKTVTRRLGWANLKPGQRVQAVVKAMGLRKGERLKKLCVIEIVKNEPEELEEIVRDQCRCLPLGMSTADRGCPVDCDRREVAREGFHDLTAEQFVEMFCQHMKVTPQTAVNRIVFKYVEEVPFR